MVDRCEHMAMQHMDLQLYNKITNIIILTIITIKIIIIIISRTI